MDLDNIKRGLRAEIKKRENEQYATFQCNVRQMCKDVLAKLEEQESEIAELKAQVHDYAQCLYVMQARAEKEACHHKYKRCLAMASKCRLRARWFGDNAFYKKEQWALKWHKRWLELAEKFNLNKSTAQ
mgnify:CR=1 FL=1